MTKLLDRVCAPRIAPAALIFVALAAGITFQACGGVAPDGQSAGQTAEELKILGIEIPAPTLTIGVGDAGVVIDPVGTIGKIIPDTPSPIPAINAVATGLLGELPKVTVAVGDAGLTIDPGGAVKGLLPEAGILPDPVSTINEVTGGIFGALSKLPSLSVTISGPSADGGVTVPAPIQLPPLPLPTITIPWPGVDGGIHIP
jgi:hypothetical protein